MADPVVPWAMQTSATVLDDALVERLYATAKADRWSLPVAQFRAALEASVARAFGGRTPAAREVERYLTALHLEDLGLAWACAAGSEAAWDHVVLEYRPILYRSADALDASGSAREVADSLYGELFGRSLFRYFHGRSSLATWLRSVLAQRFVDWTRSRKRLDPLPVEESAAELSAPPAPDPDVAGYRQLMQRALGDAVGRLAPRDRMRLGCYYAQQLTLAEIGRLLGEHEATVSRQLAKARRTIREDVERTLRAEAGLADEAIARCFEVAVEDAGELDLSRTFGSTEGGKKTLPERSKSR
jgi:RNA polymerase sigma factor (sigma-70 family)